MENQDPYTKVMQQKKKRKRMSNTTVLVIFAAIGFLNILLGKVFGIPIGFFSAIIGVILKQFINVETVATVTVVSDIFFSAWFIFLILAVFEYRRESKNSISQQPNFRKEQELIAEKLKTAQAKLVQLDKEEKEEIEKVNKEIEELRSQVR